ncbi:MAG: ribosome maturation factor RimM [Acidimicrobiia bacterium]|nr:ribosome maturation factor RimM [Acidimicrobiia bacterium]MDH3397458.1 ribosome maturation factor RimM [Acidimicrobiia bacterium]
MEERVIVGRIGRAHGLAGEVYVLSESDTPDRFRSGAGFLTDEQPPRRLEVRSSRRHQAKLLVVFAEVASRTDAESMRDVGLTIAADERRSLGDDEYWPDELVGLTVRDLAGQPVGTIAGVDTGGPQDRLVVRSADGREALVPFVRELVPEVRIEEGSVIINPIEGLLNPSRE